MQKLKQWSWLLALLAFPIFGLIGRMVIESSLVIKAPEIKEPEIVRTWTVDPSATPPAVLARSVWIFERNTESVAWELNSYEATPVASLTKIATALVARKSYDLEETVQIATGAAALGNSAGFFARDAFTVSDLLKATLLFSANDAAEALAWHHPEGKSGFVEAMNSEAQRLHVDGVFRNSTGLEEGDQISSAATVGRLAHELLRDEWSATVVASSSAMLTELKTNRRDMVYSTNALLNPAKGITGIKTGTTDQAGECLALRIQPPALDPSEQPYDFIIIITGSSNRYQDARNLISWLQVVKKYQEELL